MEKGKPPTPRVYLAEWLSEKKMSQADLSRVTGVSDGYLSLIISGKKPNVSLPMLGVLAKGLKIPPGFLLFEPTALLAPFKIDRADFAALQNVKDRAKAPRGRSQ